MEKDRCTGIILSAGKGKRMGAEKPKQYLDLEGYPVLYYALRAFQDSPRIDDIICVVSRGEEDRVKKEIVDHWHFHKVKRIVPGGKERYHSVLHAVRAIEYSPGEEDYVFIHDGARPLITPEVIERGYQCVKKTKACAAGVKCTDTIKMTEDNGEVIATLNRDRLWRVQTPQVFETALIREAYERLAAEDDVIVTDDAQVVELMLKKRVCMFQGDPRNIKVTEPVDMELAKGFLRQRYSVGSEVSVKGQGLKNLLDVKGSLW